MFNLDIKVRKTLEEDQSKIKILLNKKMFNSDLEIKVNRLHFAQIWAQIAVTNTSPGVSRVALLSYGNT